MAVNPKDVEAVNKILWPDEKVEITVRQRHVGPGGSITTPTSVIATDKRVIILNRASFGIRQDYEAIPYSQIASVRLEHGVISSSVYVRVMGYDVDKGLLKNGRQEGEIDGLNNKDAQELADYINRKVGDLQSGANVQQSADTSSVYCTKCGSPNPASAKFCAHCGAKLQI